MTSELEDAGRAVGQRFEEIESRLNALEYNQMDRSAVLDLIDDKIWDHTESKHEDRY